MMTDGDTASADARLSRASRLGLFLRPVSSWLTYAVPKPDVFASSVCVHPFSSSRRTRFCSLWHCQATRPIQDQRYVSIESTNDVCVSAYDEHSAITHKCFSDASRHRLRKCAVEGNLDVRICWTL